MNPIDQIRKALEAGPTPGPWLAVKYSAKRFGLGQVGDGAFFFLQCVNDSTDDPAAKADARFIAACNPSAIAALLASHDAAVQRAAEMQERCARVADGYVADPNQPIAQTDYDRGWIRGATRIAAAIRAIKE